MKRLVFDFLHTFEKLSSYVCIYTASELFFTSHSVLNGAATASKTELDHVHFLYKFILAVEHKCHYNFRRQLWAECNFCVLKDAQLRGGIKFFWRCNYISYGISV